MSIIRPNPKILKWARESAGYEVEEVVTKLKRKGITKEVLLKWECGQAFPSYSQLERLAYEIYKRTLAVFFFPNPPNENEIKKSFRTAPKALNNLSPKMRIILRKAYAMQLNVMELGGIGKTEEEKIFKNIRFTMPTPIDDLAQKVRSYLGISLEEQKKWKNPEEALQKWREAIQEAGIFVFKDSFSDPDFSGFCLYDINHPIIYLNNNEEKARQIFTLFHELAHILSQTSGFDPIKENHFKRFTSESHQNIERRCNHFAGAFLVPTSSLPKNNEIRKPLRLDYIRKHSLIYSVSREVFLRRLLDNKQISASTYNSFRQEIQKEIQKKHNLRSKKKTKGGSYYATKETYLGEKYILLAFRKYYKRQISLKQLTGFLDVKSNAIHQLEPFKKSGRFQP